jgi:hypothetical protein
MSFFLQLQIYYTIANDYLNHQIDQFVAIPQVHDFFMTVYFYISFIKSWCWISFVNWLDVTGLEDTDIPGYKWVVYTHLGQRYRLLISKPRGPSSTVDEKLMEQFGQDHDEIVGPFGDYHGQLELLRQLTAEE